MISEDIKKKLSEFNIKRDFVFKIATNGGGSQEFYIKSTDPHFIFRKLGKTLNSGKTTYKSKS
ncbi:MAG TPA: hypothetical protein PLW93_06410, partial [Candidatus Absconditabacterales bacterium]|nr:hypothetical protein [Candidatus Absconditabacterales bacterium]